jgi:hypothetical protein
MNWKTPSVLSLQFLALLFLAAAAAPPPDCQPGATNGQAFPIPLDLAGRPQSGLNDQTFAGLPGDNGCRSPLPSSAQSSTLQDNSGDVLHGLPMPDTLRPIDQPKRAPDFQ